MGGNSYKKGHTKLPSFGELTRTFAAVGVGSEKALENSVQQESLPVPKEEFPLQSINANTGNIKPPTQAPFVQEGPSNFEEPQRFMRNPAANPNEQNFQIQSRANNQYNVMFQQEQLNQPGIPIPQSGNLNSGQAFAFHPDPHFMTVLPPTPMVFNPSFISNADPPFPYRIQDNHAVPQAYNLRVQSIQPVAMLQNEGKAIPSIRDTGPQSSQISPTDTGDRSSIPRSQLSDTNLEASTNEDYSTRKLYKFPPLPKPLPSLGSSISQQSSNSRHKRDSSHIGLSEERGTSYNRLKRKQINKVKESKHQKSSSNETLFQPEFDSKNLSSKFDEFRKHLKILNDFDSKYIEPKLKQKEISLAMSSLQQVKSAVNSDEDLSGIPNATLNQALQSNVAISRIINRLRVRNSTLRLPDSKHPKNNINKTSTEEKPNRCKTSSETLHLKKRPKRHQRNAFSEGSIKPESFKVSPTSALGIGETALLKVGPIAPRIVSEESVSFVGSHAGLHQELSMKKEILCLQCGSNETPEWRKGPKGARTLCNACGLFHSKLIKKIGERKAEEEMKLRRESGRGNDRKVN